MVFVSSKGNQKSLSMTFPVALSTPTAALMWMYDKSDSFTINFLYSFGSLNVLFSSSTLFSLLCFSFCAALRSTSAGNTKFTSSSPLSSSSSLLVLLLLLNLDLMVVYVFSGTLLIPSAFAFNVMLVTIPRPRITSIGSLFPVANMTLISGFPRRFESDRGVINSSEHLSSSALVFRPVLGVIGSTISPQSSSSIFPLFSVGDRIRDEALFPFVVALIRNARICSPTCRFFSRSPFDAAAAPLPFTLKPCTTSVGSLLAGDRMRIRVYSSVMVMMLPLLLRLLFFVAPKTHANFISPKNFGSAQWTRTRRPPPPRDLSLSLESVFSRRLFDSPSSRPMR
mmetsp:Transcript_3774/g.11610  ORF Transcript_3774/g.11610 Transcript_3774/m.11610 type:complete len:339 (+) Transcript_3774:2099-3115(+)